MDSNYFDPTMNYTDVDPLTGQPQFFGQQGQTSQQYGFGTQGTPGQYGTQGYASQAPLSGQSSLGTGSYAPGQAPAYPGPSAGYGYGYAPNPYGGYAPGPHGYAYAPQAPLTG